MEELNLLFLSLILMETMTSISPERLAKVKYCMVARKFVEDFYNSTLLHAICKIMHLALGFNANIALSFAFCYISHLRLLPHALFFI